MVRIKCVNLNCTSPTKSFDWDETKRVNPGGGVAQPHEPGAVRVSAVCPFCSAENLIWLKNVKRNQPLFRGNRQQ
jgi:hypothetical protein